MMLVVFPENEKKKNSTDHLKGKNAFQITNTRMAQNSTSNIYATSNMFT